jgi:nicotinamide-nucleotide amidase
MNVTLISIGDELLFGITVNSNFAWIGQKLLNVGISVSQQITIGDDKTQIHRVLKEYIPSSDAIVITGGLGPTHDDVTPNALYTYFNDEPEFDPSYWAQLESYFIKKKIPIPKLNKNQALTSKKGTMILNPLGSARGLHYTEGNTSIYALPGVPIEMESMMMNYVIPHLKKNNNNHFFVKTIRTIGRGESSIAEQISPIVQQFSDSCSIAFLPQLSGVDIRITSKNKIKFQSLINILNQKLDTLIFGEDDESVEIKIGNILNKKQKTIALAESCTGGFVGHKLTSVSGSSSYFVGGVVAYRNEIKKLMLEVNEATISKFGAVSENTALEMAGGVRKIFNSSIGLSLTGIAGPKGGTIDKPVGLVYIGYSSEKNHFAKKYIFHGNRYTIKYRATYSALDLVRRQVIHE